MRYLLFMYDVFKYRVFYQDLAYIYLNWLQILIKQYIRILILEGNYDFTP